MRIKIYTEDYTIWEGKGPHPVPRLEEEVYAIDPNLAGTPDAGALFPHKVLQVWWRVFEEDLTCNVVCGHASLRDWKPD